jgi:hypothetical protein
MGNPALRTHVCGEFGNRGVTAEDERLPECEKRIALADAVDGNAGGKEGLKKSEPVEESVGAAGNESEPAAGFAMDEPAEAATRRRAAEFDDLLVCWIEKHGCFSAGTDQSHRAGSGAFHERLQSLGQGAPEFRTLAKNCV